MRLGDRRRTRRLVDSARRISRHPGGTLPEKLKHPAAYRATLRLMNHPDVTHAAILEPHIQATLDRLRHTPTTVLILHDITELDYSNQATLAAMGQIGNGGGRGYECHNALAVDPDSGERVLCTWAEVTLKAPHVRRGRHSREPLVVWALRVWEVDAPVGVTEPLE